jgi:hypothetical protein
MPDHTESIESIASSLSVIAHANDSPLNAVLSVATTLVSVGLGWLVGWWPARSAQLAKRKLIHALLRDEVTLRWQGDLKTQLDQLCALSGRSFVETLARTRFGESGLRIAKVVGDDFADLSVIGDPKFVSTIVYCSVLMQDLTAAAVHARQVLEEYRRREDELLEQKMEQPDRQRELERIFSVTMVAMHAEVVRKHDELNKALESVLQEVRLKGTR